MRRKIIAGTMMLIMSVATLVSCNKHTTYENENSSGTSEENDVSMSKKDKSDLFEKYELRYSKPTSIIVRRGEKHDGENTVEVADADIDVEETIELIATESTEVEIQPSAENIQESIASSQSVTEADQNLVIETQSETDFTPSYEETTVSVQTTTEAEETVPETTVADSTLKVNKFKGTWQCGGETIIIDDYPHDVNSDDDWWLDYFLAISDDLEYGNRAIEGNYYCSSTWSRYGTVKFYVSPDANVGTFYASNNRDWIENEWYEEPGGWDDVEDIVIPEYYRYCINIQAELVDDNTMRISGTYVDDYVPFNNTSQKDQPISGTYTRVR